MRTFFPAPFQSLGTVFICCFGLLACSPGNKTITTPTGLSYTILRAGSGETAQSGDRVKIHEIVTFEDGRLFFTTREGNPIAINLGANQIIKGLEEGVIGMRVGELRKLVVPPALSQRSEYPPGLRPEDVLIYEVELISIESSTR